MVLIPSGRISLLLAIDAALSIPSGIAIILSQSFVAALPYVSLLHRYI